MSLFWGLERIYAKYSPVFDGLSFIMWGGGGIKTTSNDYNGKQKHTRAAV